MYSLAFEQQMGGNTVLALEYSGSRGIHQYSISDFNRSGSGIVYGGLDPAAVSSPNVRLNQQYTGINWRGSDGDANYHAVNVRVQSANFASLGLTLAANYTWAHAIDNLSTTFSEVGTSAVNLGFLDPFRPGIDRGNADFDVRHRLSPSFLYESPLGKNSTGWMRQLLGGWSFAPIFTANTGTPYSIFDCTNAVEYCPRYTPASGGVGIPLTGSTDGPPIAENTFAYLTLPAANNFDSPLLGPAFSDFGMCTTPGQGNAGTTSSIGGGTLTVPTSCPYPADMTRRNAFRGPNHWNLDLGVYKSFALTERVNMQLRGEAFNIFNHPNDFINGPVDISATGLDVQAKKGGLGLNPSFDTRERRNMQLGLKVTF